MKKIILALLLGCFAMLPVACDKDDEGIDNPFAGTVWKCRSQISGAINGYKCFRFKRDLTYLYYEEDENGVIVKRWADGSPYRLGRKEGLETMTYYWSDNQVRGEIYYGRGMPGSFTDTESDGKTYTYVLQ